MSTGTNKRARLSPDPYNNHHAPRPASLYQTASAYAATSSPPSNSNSSSSFRNVSACNRCRIRKNRCDQNLPACTSCEKAGVKCVGFDPITKREIPRTYVYFLESRVSYLEELLVSNGIPFASPSSDFDLGSKPISDHPSGPSPPSDSSNNPPTVQRGPVRPFNHIETTSESGSEWEQKEESDKLNKLVSNIGMVSVQGASDPRYLGSTSGISFARVVFAAIKSSVNEKNGGRASKSGSIDSAAAISSTSMRDSFFGLHSKPNMKPAPFPDRELGLKLVNLYFEYANPQIPILHRGEFMGMFTRAYASKDRQRSPRELYLLNIVFAIGAGIILPEPAAKKSPEMKRTDSSSVKQEPSSPTLKRSKSASIQRQPEEYHSSAMMHLESFLGSMPASDKPEGFGGGLEQLQAVLLLAGFALLRPVAPGLWYIIGVAVRLGVDLGLHSEDNGDEDGIASTTARALRSGSDRTPTRDDINPDPSDKGRRQWMRDLRRRLWWCVYSFDRLVSTCVGRPFGVTDQVITTQWYTVLEDKDITPENGFLLDPDTYSGPSSKRVGYHYLRLRLLQSEILQVLQHRQAKKAMQNSGPMNNQYMHTNLSCAFLQPFDGSFHAWRVDIDRRLWEWKESAPLHVDTNVSFNVQFLELNYWQAVIMLYRQSLSVPETLASEKGPHTEVESPLSPHIDDHEDEEDIFLKVAEAGQTVLKLYRQLHRVHLVNYTYLATVHLFMAGIAFLYSIWHSPTVRARLTLEDVDFTVLAGTSVLNDLTEKCPPAEACRDAFDRMSKATIKMCQSTTGFGSQVKFSKERPEESPIVPQPFEKPFAPPPYPGSRFSISRPPPTFDYNLKDLFSDTISDVQQNSLGSDSSSRHPPHFRDPNYNPSASSRSHLPAQNYDSRLLNTSGGSFNPSNNNNNNNSSSLYTFGPSGASAAAANMSTPASSTDFDFDFLLNNDSAPLPPTYNTGAGLNLGFDGRHEWGADGAGGGTGAGQSGMPDLFADFFFGGAGQVGNAAMGIGGWGDQMGGGGSGGGGGDADGSASLMEGMMGSAAGGGGGGGYEASDAGSSIPAGDGAWGGGGGG